MITPVSAGFQCCDALQIIGFRLRPDAARLAGMSCRTTDTDFPMTRVFTLFLLAAALALTAACSQPTPTVTQADIDALAQEIRGLGSDVDPEEAARAARIAYTYSLQLREEYNVTDPPIIHNAKVINGFRERGLCNHWAEDLKKRLDQEGFRTLQVQRAIAPPVSYHIIHHSAVITRRGDSIYDGVVIDPWRHGGLLYWAPTRQDDRYAWRPRSEVLREMLEAKQARKAAISD